MKYLGLLFFLMLPTMAVAQPNAYERSQSSSELYARLEKLRSPLRILYIAAHPDDENSRLIASLSRDYKAHVTYLSLTRGSGGQNRIGTEQGTLLGVLRTQELLSARRIDGARQEFTSAYDFGYSKTPEETLEQWDSAQLVLEIVDHIRALQPHLVITRFPTTGEGGHGHHTASAILAEVAFEAASDAEFPSELPPWQPVRLLWNTWIPERVDAADTLNLLSLDIDSYSALDGLSTSHIAAHSRSQNQCQSFGTSYESGNYKTWFKVLAGKPAVNSIFEQCPGSWPALSPSLRPFDESIATILSAYNFQDPSSSAMQLADLKSALALSTYRDQLLDSMQYSLLPELFVTLAGIEVSARARQAEYLEGTTDSIEIHINNRMGVNVEFPLSELSDQTQYLGKNEHTVRTIQHTFTADNRHILIPIRYQTKTSEVVWEVRVPIRYVSNHDVYGEQSQSVVLLPAVTAKVQDMLYWTSLRPTTTEITLTNRDGQPHSVDVATTPGWTASPNSFTIEAGATASFPITITPSEIGVLGSLHLELQSTGQQLYAIESVAYPHIEHQQVLTPATIVLSQTGARITNKLVAYIHGVGDKIPSVLAQLGVDVTVLEPSAITPQVLSNFEVVVLGIRSYNAIANMEHLHSLLLDYCDKGGTVVVQYVTTRNRLYPFVGPYDLEVSWNRITEERAPLTVHFTTHEVFTYPNPVDQRDFENWVQERGLYFGKPARRGDYIDLVYGNDTGEEQIGGALLVTEYGMGTWVYTGLSFFRQLPAGVPGAIQLYMNILSL